MVIATVAHADEATVSRAPASAQPASEVAAWSLTTALCYGA